MKSPEAFDETLLAPCGVNCGVCYRRVMPRRRGKPCGGCLGDGAGRAGACRECAIRECAANKELRLCAACRAGPCARLRNLDGSYRKRYGVSPRENGRRALEAGVAAFMKEELAAWTCRCGGLISLHDGVCGECGREHARRNGGGAMEGGE